MRLRSIMLIVLAAFAASLAVAPAALAAGGDQALADFRDDGIIAGDYQLSELRAADGRITPQEREYYGWDLAYNEAVQRINNPDAPPSTRLPTVPPQDFDNDGEVDADDVAEAKKRTTELRKERAEDCENEAEDAASIAECAPFDAPEAEPADDTPAATKGDDDSGDDSSNALVALLLLIPAAIIGIGVWRMQRTRRAGSKAGNDLDGDAPTSSFARGDDLS